jgi:hypothetical protein
MVRSRFGCLATFVFILGLLSCICLLFAPRQAGAETPVVVTNWPTPMATAIPVPTACAAPLPGSSPSASPVCGVASVTVGHAAGERGYDFAQFVATIFGFGFLGVCVLVVGLVKR